MVRHTKAGHLAFTTNIGETAPEKNAAPEPQDAFIKPAEPVFQQPDSHLSPLPKTVILEHIAKSTLEQELRGTKDIELGQILQQYGQNVAKAGSYAGAGTAVASLFDPTLTSAVLSIASQVANVGGRIAVAKGEQREKVGRTKRAPLNFMQQSQQAIRESQAKIAQLQRELNEKSSSSPPSDHRFNIENEKIRLQRLIADAEHTVDAHTHMFGRSRQDSANSLERAFQGYSRDLENHLSTRMPDAHAKRASRVFGATGDALTTASNILPVAQAIAHLEPVSSAVFDLASAVTSYGSLAAFHGEQIADVAARRDKFGLATATTFNDHSALMTLDQKEIFITYIQNEAAIAQDKWALQNSYNKISELTNQNKNAGIRAPEIQLQIDRENDNIRQLKENIEFRTPIRKSLTAFYNQLPTHDPQPLDEFLQPKKTQLEPESEDPDKSQPDTPLIKKFHVVQLTPEEAVEHNLDEQIVLQHQLALLQSPAPDIAKINASQEMISELIAQKESRLRDLKRNLAAYDRVPDKTK